MTFDEALKLMRDGVRMRRKQWCDSITIVVNEQLINSNGETTDLTYQSILADDWEIAND